MHGGLPLPSLQFSIYTLKVKRHLVATICLSIFLTHFIASSNAATKAGSTCSKLKSTTVSGGVKYTCIKSGSKLVWSKGVKVVSNTPKPSVSPAPTPTSTPLATDLPVIRTAAITNNTFYSDLFSCHSRGINAELQALEGGTWKRLVGAMGWNDATNCPASHPVQPWVAVEVPAGTTLRWRFWLTGTFDLNSATFISLTKKIQTTTPATPTAKPSASATAKPSASATDKPSASATDKPSVMSRPVATPSPTVTNAPTVAPTPAQSNSSTQSPFVISNTNLKSIFNNFVTLTTSGGVGNGAVTFSATGANCTVNGNLLAANIVTRCSVTASKASSNGGSNTVSQAVIFEFTAQPLILGYTKPTGLVGQTIYLTHSGGSGNGRVSYSSEGTANCVVWDENGGTNSPSKLYIRPTNVGTCTVTLQKAESPGFPLAQSEPVTFTFGTVNQPPLTISSIPTTILKVGDSFKLSATSSLTNSATNPIWIAAVTYSVAGEGCSIRTERVTSGGIISTISYVTSTSAANCNVTATSNVVGYNPQTSPPVSFPFGFYNQQPFSISSASSAFEGSLVSITPTGGSGNGAISFAVTGPNCSISGSNVTASAPTTCEVTGTKASKDGFSAITSLPISVVFQKVDLVDQQPFNINFSQTKFRAGEYYTGRTSGGSGTGAVTFTLSGENCLIPTNVRSGTGNIAVTANQAASCAVIATKAGSIGFKPAQSQYVYIDFRVDKQAPIYIIKDMIEKSFGMCNGCGNWLGINGGTGSGKVSYSVTGDNCSLSGSYLTATAETTCTVTATKAASVGYDEVSSAPTSFVFKTQNQYLYVSGNVSTQKIPLEIIVSAQTFGGGTGAVTGVVTGQNCFYETASSTPWIIRLRATAATTCQVTATKEASIGLYATTSPPVNFIFTSP